MPGVSVAQSYVMDGWMDVTLVRPCVSWLPTLYAPWCLSLALPVSMPSDSDSRGLEHRQYPFENRQEHVSWHDKSLWGPEFMLATTWPQNTKYFQSKFLLIILKSVLYFFIHFSNSVAQFFIKPVPLTSKIPFQFMTSSLSSSSGSCWHFFRKDQLLWETEKTRKVQKHSKQMV